jgi:beta-glucosidase-like glycosyl hydrolase
MKTLLLATSLIIIAAVGNTQAALVEDLAANHRLGVPVAQARQIESRLGQLLVINVDGFGYSGTLALAPAFTDLVHEIQVGGVIPHYGSTDYAKIMRTNRALAGLTALPLLLCSDIVKLSAPVGMAAFGDGYVGGFLGKYRGLKDGDLDTLARLNAFVFRALGINVALGPTIDTSTGEPRVVERARIVIDDMRRYGLVPVLKHFPTLPAQANLHRESPDERLPLGEIAPRLGVFHALSNDADVVMTTHFRDTSVDPQIVTFSPAWNALLRDTTGFKGLLVSDGLLMLKNYTDRAALAGGPSPRETAGIDQTALWAARAILAGHDMVIVEGSAAQTMRVFDGLLALACSGTTLGNSLAARIQESWARISAWKEARAEQLRRTVDVPVSTIQAVIRLLPGAQAGIAQFTFDGAALARLEPLLSSAETKELPARYPGRG